jgi:hypothetical protein
MMVVERAAHNWTAPLIVLLLVIGAFVLRSVTDSDAHRGFSTHVYTGTITASSPDGHEIGFKIETGGPHDGDGFAYGPGVHDDTVKVGEHVALYTVDIPGDGERIARIVPKA